MKSQIGLEARKRRNHCQRLSGAGAVTLTEPTTRCTSTGASQALTLADGRVIGQRKRIVHAVDGGSVVLTAGAALHLGDSLATITLAAVRDWIELEWDVVSGTGAWYLVGWYGTGVTFS